MRAILLGLAAMIVVMAAGFGLLAYVVFPLVLPPVPTWGGLLGAVGMACVVGFVVGFVGSVVGGLVESESRLRR
jgi:hypothetical protein